MLGVVRCNQLSDTLTQYFISSPYDNAFVIDTDGVLICEIDQATWRHFLWVHQRGNIELGDAASIIQGARQASGGRPSFRNSNSRLRQLMAVLDTQRRLKMTQVVQDSTVGRPLSAHGLIMAGGFGRRLGELTKSVPKPMLEIRGKPIAEHLVDSLVDNGIEDIFMSVYYLKDVVSDHFGDGSAHGARIRYLTETTPLGTGGCLSMLASEVTHPVLVVNGDVATDLQFSRLLDFHLANEADVTISIRQHPITVPFGVVDINQAGIVTIHEKPRYTFDINVAIYVLSPRAIRQARIGHKIDMPDLIQNLIVMGYKAVVFPMFENWIDIGSIVDFNRARETYDPAARPRLRGAGAEDEGWRDLSYGTRRN